MLTLNDLGFIRCVKESETSSVFQVSLQGRLCLMKVVSVSTPGPRHLHHLPNCP
ncbi:hypothetical protein ASPTUDRAFT_531968 [Aspergillus tubingensis CBS 134.48]|uniref:Uncharacterized protein n=1 Tax=Aspergillus tubingensis (strain CBS 134.48) TaxID=767770 RepID=A0A1L9N5V2_ASPTC|nr:hypothetical protein ASPTUDRAFT_531968 [Aspergillus tubingensis CBS 134.48]